MYTKPLEQWGFTTLLDTEFLRKRLMYPRVRSQRPWLMALRTCLKRQPAFRTRMWRLVVSCWVG